MFLNKHFVWLYIVIMSCTCFRVNPHSIVAWTSTIECGFTLKRVCGMIRTYTQMHRTDKYSQHSSIIWPVWLNGWVFLYELRGWGFESSCSHVNISYISGAYISEIKQCYNAKHSAYHFYVKTRILADFDIFISVPVTKIHLRLKQSSSTDIVLWIC